jgi:O-acetyl-ADP-ribose deacetylase (regulator of RNase III)
LRKKKGKKIKINKIKKIMKIVTIQGDITTIECDAIVNPANSLGYMGGGVAYAIKKVGGNKIEKEAIIKAPIKVGDAIYTTAGNLKCNYIIHAPTMKKPAMKINTINVELATRAALNLAKKLNLKHIAFPGMGTGVGNILPDIAAKTIINIIKKHEEIFDKITLIDKNEKMISSFKKYA